MTELHHRRSAAPLIAALAVVGTIAVLGGALAMHSGGKPGGQGALSTTPSVSGVGTASGGPTASPLARSSPVEVVTPANQPVGSPSSRLSLTNLRMFSATRGWGLELADGRAPSQGSGVHVVRTEDGGQHWSTALSDGLDAVAVDFHDADDGWVLEADSAGCTASCAIVTVASTSDAGGHWTTSPRLRIDGMATRVQFIDASHGWVFATPSAGGAAGGQDTTLYRTVDRGASWQAMKPPSQVRGSTNVRGSLPEACAGGGTIGAPTFSDDANGWLGAFCHHVFFYATHDGGLTWAPQSLPPFPGPPPTDDTAGLYAVDAPLFTSPHDGVVFVHRGFTTGAGALQDAAMYATHNGGAAWSPVRLPAAERAATFLDGRHGWIVAAGVGGDLERRSLYATADGGLTWKLASGPEPYFDQEISFVDARTGFVAAPPSSSSARVLESRDSGATWISVAAALGG